MFIRVYNLKISKKKQEALLFTKAGISIQISYNISLFIQQASSCKRKSV